MKKHLSLIIYKLISLKHSLIFKKACVIPRICRKYKYSIYKGNIFISIRLDKFFIGHRFGTLVFTRKPHAFSKKIKLKKNIIKR